MKKLILLGFEIVLTVGFIVTVVSFVAAYAAFGYLYQDGTMAIITGVGGLIVGWLFASVVFGVAYLLLDIRDELRKTNHKFDRDQMERHAK